MTRRHGKWKSALALLAGLTMVGATITDGAPITMTEANWNDDVNVNATLTSSQYVGQNYARASASNGTMSRSLTTSNFRGVVSTVNSTATPYRVDSGDERFSAAGILNLIYLESEARSCARVGTTSCVDDPVGPPSVPAFAVSRFNSMEVKTSQLLGAWLVRYQGGAGNPIKTTASCTPGELGVPGINAGTGVQLRNGGGSTTLQVPTVNGTEVTGTAQNTGLWRYHTSLRYESDSDINYARSEVRMTINAVGALGDTPWDLDLLLSRAECGLSKPLGGGVVPVASEYGMTMNAVMDEALAVETEDSGAENESTEAGTLDDTIAALGYPEANTVPPISEVDSEIEAGSTSTTIPELPDLTLTNNSGSPGTSTSKSTDATASTRKSTSPTPTSTRSTPVEAIPSSTSPAKSKDTSTTTVPTAVIPDEPGELSRTARFQDVDTITAGDEELDVVAKKTDDLPTDAEQGAAALEIWLGGGTAGTIWKIFTSDDEEKDGWRWAAINQQSGTVIYVR